MAQSVKNGAIKLQNNQHNYNTRNSQQLHSSQFKTKFHQTNVDFMAAKIYNQIPTEIKNLAFKKFSKNLKDWLLEKAFYSIDELNRNVDI